MKSNPIPRSGLERIIPPEIKNDEFYNLIVELAATERITTVLEIGSSAGGGSTEAFVAGLGMNPYARRLFCMELSQPRFAELQQRYADKAFVKCYNTSSVSLSKFSTSSDVEVFYSSYRTNLNCFPLPQVLGWLKQDIEYVQQSGHNEDGITRIRQENGILHFDMVLIDGSEFTGKSELDEVYGACWILLDDINIYKNFENYHRLCNDPDYELYREDWRVRNGYAVFRRRDIEPSNHLVRTVKPLILVDGIFFQFRHTGITRVWINLLTEWAKTDFASSVLLLDRAGTAPTIAGIRTRTIPAYDYDAAMEDRVMLQTICDEERAALFVSTYYTTPLTTPSVFYGYDMIPENTDYFDLNHPLWQVKHYGIRHASAFIAISRSTAYDIIRFHPAAANKVTVAHCAVDVDHFHPSTSEEIDSFRRQYNIDAPYLIFIGDRTLGYKNAELLFQALRRKDSASNFEVVCVGGNKELEDNFASIAPNTKVRVLAMNDNLLRVAYTGAIALVFPSIYEGFGLPILEAMASGCPVITCHNSSIPEVAGAAALYVGEFRPDELISAIQQVQQPDVREGLIAMGYKQVKRFSWSKMADNVKSALEAVVCKGTADND